MHGFLHNFSIFKRVWKFIFITGFKNLVLFNKSNYDFMHFVFLLREEKRGGNKVGRTWFHNDLLHIVFILVIVNPCLNCDSKWIETTTPAIPAIEMVLKKWTQNYDGACSIFTDHFFPEAFLFAYRLTHVRFLLVGNILCQTLCLNWIAI